MKRCQRCKKNKKKSNFTKNKSQKDGLSNYCRPCQKKYDRARYPKEIKRRRKNAIDYRKKNPPNQKQVAKNVSNWRNKFPEKFRTHRIVANEIRMGRLFKKPCKKCGSKKVQAHHSDYSKPLKVMWLCSKHHQELHRKVIHI